MFSSSWTPLLQGEPGEGNGAGRPKRPSPEPEAEDVAAREAGVEEQQPVLQRGPSTVVEWVDERRPWRRCDISCLRALCMCLCRCGAGLLDCSWAIGARCIVVDLAFSYAWSSFLTCVCFLTVALYMLEYAFDSVLQDLPSCGRCFQARLLIGCEQAGGPPSGEALPQCGMKPESVPLDPFGEVAMTCDLLGWSMLATVALVSLANSRYLKGCRCLSLLVLPAALLSSFVYAYFGVWDFFGVCISSFNVDWQPYAPVGVGPSWSGPPDGPARRIGEYCRSLAEDKADELPGEHMQALRMASSVKNIWAAWMESASFSVRLDSCWDLRQYCSHAGREVLDCLTWLNTSAVGNALECRHALLDPVFILAGCASDASDMSQQYKAREGALCALSDCREEPLGCHAVVSGQSFALRHQQLAQKDAGVVAYHLLSLATRGLGCPEDLSPDGQGPRQMQRSLSACVFDGKIMALPSGGTQLLPLSWTTPYLQQDFFRCVVQDVSRCSLLELGAARTSFRSFSGTACSLLLLAGLVWVLLVRVFWRCCPRRCMGAKVFRSIRSFLSSRIVWGYIVVTLMQVGFTWTSVKVLWAYKYHDRFIWLGFQLQGVVVVLAIVYNGAQYLQLRRQIMSLPADVLFGEEPPPASYRGPDIEDFKEMGASSILYAMYFPGMLFWRFFFASWILASLAVATVYLFAQVLRPKSERDPNIDDKLFHVVSAMLFVIAIALAHFLTRVFMQSCLLEEHLKGIRVRCICLFSWWELMTCFLGLAIGPATSLFDFIKGFFTTALASLIVQRPNFTQFGELSDYVFCTYCASLYLERMSEDLRKDHPDFELLEAEAEAEGHAEFVRLDRYDEGDFGRGGALMLEEASYRYLCPARCLCFLLLFVGVPCLAAVLLDFLRAQYDYPCESHAWYLPCWSWDTL